MAVTTTQTSMSATQRRLVYGLNVTVNVLLAVALTILVVWIAGRFGDRWDLSSTGVNSLSPRSLNMLRKLPDNVSITALYTAALDEVQPLKRKYRERVADLLGLYETAARGKVRVELIDPRREVTRAEKLLKDLAAKPSFAEEAAPHRAALEQFDALQTDLTTFSQSEMQGLAQVAQDPEAARIPQAAIFRVAFDGLLQELARTRAEIDSLRGEALPLYGNMAESVSKLITDCTTSLREIQGWMTNVGPSVPRIAPTTRAFFNGAEQRYAAILTRLGEDATRFAALKPVQLETLQTRLARGEAVIVETAANADVLTLEDVWPFRADASAPPPPDGDPREFAGEQAISSAILKLTQKDKTGVVFVRAGGSALLTPDFSQFNMMNARQMPRAPFERLAEMLVRQNFVTREWDVLTESAPPVIDGVGRLVYVVLPPAPQQAQGAPMPMPTMLSAEQSAAVRSAVEQSGMAIFMNGWAQPGEGAYAWDEYLRDNWRIRMRPEFMLMEFVPHPQKADRYWPLHRDQGSLTGLGMLSTSSAQFTDHPITQPLRSLPGLFYFASPVETIPEPAPSTAPASASAPAARPAVQHTPLMRIPQGVDAWAVADVFGMIREDLNSQEGTAPRAADLTAPLTVALAAERADGDRLVVFGSRDFAADEIAQASTLAAAGNMITFVTAYPANADLLINAVHWLTGDADRIAVGPRSSDIPRLSRLREGAQTTFAKFFLVGVWPALFLLAGVAVGWMRRR